MTDSGVKTDVWALWQSLVDSQEELSPFLMPDWYRALESRIPTFRSCPRLLEIQGEPVVLPLASSNWRMGMRVLESGPWATYGGFIARGRVFVEEGIELLTRIPSLNEPVLRFTTPPGFDTLPVAGPQVERETLILDLRSGYETLHDRVFTRQMRAGIRQAHEYQVEVYPAATDEEDRAFRELYHLSQKRWSEGTEAFPDSFLAGWSQEPDRFARLWLARFEGVPVAGALILYGKKIAHYIAGAGNQDAFKTRPNHLLFATIVAEACDRGCLSLNLGSSAGLKGVERFKQQMGAKPDSYCTVSFDHRVVRGMRRIRGR